MSNSEFYITSKACEQTIKFWLAFIVVLDLEPKIHHKFYNYLNGFGLSLGALLVPLAGSEHYFSALLVTLGGHGGNFWSHWDPFTFGVVAVPLAGKAHD